MNAIPSTPDNLTDIFAMLAPPAQSASQNPAFLNLISVVFGAVTPVAASIREAQPLVLDAQPAPASDMTTQITGVLVRSMLGPIASHAAGERGDANPAAETSDPLSADVIATQETFVEVSSGLPANLNFAGTGVAMADQPMPAPSIGAPSIEEPSKFSEVDGKPPAKVDEQNAAAIQIADEVTTRRSGPSKTPLPEIGKRRVVLSPARNEESQGVSVPVPQPTTGSGVPQTPVGPAAPSIASGGTPQEEAAHRQSPSIPVAAAAPAASKAGEAFSARLIPMAGRPSEATSEATAVAAETAVEVPAQAMPIADTPVRETSGPEVASPVASEAPKPLLTQFAASMAAPDVPEIPDQRTPKADASDPKPRAERTARQWPDRLNDDLDDKGEASPRVIAPRAVQESGDYTPAFQSPVTHARPAASVANLRTVVPFQAVADALRTSEPMAISPSTTDLVPSRFSSAQTIAVRIAQADAAPVDLHVTDKGGEIHVSVRTADPGMQTSLRQDLDTLSSSLERAGYRAETFVPREAGAQGERPVQIDFRNGRESQSGPSSLGFSDSQPRRDSRQQQKRSRQSWIQELEGLK